MTLVLGHDMASMFHPGDAAWEKFLILSKEILEGQKYSDCAGRNILVMRIVCVYPA